MKSEVEAIIQSVADRLQEKPPEPHFVVFDFDNTCIVNDIQESLLAYLCRHSLLRNDSLVTSYSLKDDPQRYHEAVFLEYYKLLDDKKVYEAYRYGVRILTGFKKEEIPALTMKNIAEQGDVLGKETLFGIEIAKGLRLRTHVIDLMKELQKRGLEIWIISASSEEAVKAAADYFHLSTKIIGVKLEEKDGILTDTFIEPLSVTEGKVPNIQKYIHPSAHPLLGIGDNMNDFTMLQYCLTQAVVNRNNSLTREAEKRGWYILPED